MLFLCNKDRQQKNLLPSSVTRRSASALQAHYRTQERNEGGKGRHNSPGVESLWGRRSVVGTPKVPGMPQVLYSIQYICFRKTSG